MQPKLSSDKEIFAKTKMKQKLGLLYTSLNKLSTNPHVSVLTLHPNIRRVMKGKIFPGIYSRLLSELEFSVSLVVSQAAEKNWLGSNIF